MGWTKGKPRSLETKLKMKGKRPNTRGNQNAKRDGWAPAGMSTHELYNVYYTMIDRCNNPENKNYLKYGARGIRVCERWLENAGGQGFLNFLQDMGERPMHVTKRGKSMPCSLERKNNDGNYEPENVIWADYTVQNNNRRPFGSVKKV